MTRLRRTERLWVALAAALTCGARLLAQAPPAQSPPSALSSPVMVEPSGQAATFSFFNRPIAVLRARTFGRGPAERAGAAARALDDLVARRITGPIAQQAFDGGVLITVGTRGVLALTRLDVDELSGERVEDAAAAASAVLRQALDEAMEARAPGMLLRAAAASLAVLALALVILWAVFRAQRVVTGKFVAVAKRAGLADLDLLRASRLLEFQRGLVTSVAGALDLLLIYATAGFILRQFPYTRPWGESMRGFLVATAETLGLGVAQSIPGFFTAAIIFVLARVLTRLLGFWFAAVEEGRITARYIYPETAQPTRRLLNGLLWMFALMVAYPYLPGSQTEAFKGVTVFLGLLVTLGSSSLMNQVMSGLMVTFSRALRLGDFVKIGEVEGTVMHLGVLSIKIKNLRREEVTVPNAVVVAQTTTDYSRLAATEGVFSSTSVTIGYDAPWRQIHALLSMAAQRTPGIRREPKPVVLQMGLEDFYVRYTLFYCLERQESRYITLNTLHTHIQDLFNEHSVQIMSPNYVVDPAAPKIVPKQDWFAPPADA